MRLAKTPGSWGSNCLHSGFDAVVTAHMGIYCNYDEFDIDYHPYIFFIGSHFMELSFSVTGPLPWGCDNGNILLVPQRRSNFFGVRNFKCDGAA